MTIEQLTMIVLVALPFGASLGYFMWAEMEYHR